MARPVQRYLSDARWLGRVKGCPIRDALIARMLELNRPPADLLINRSTVYDYLGGRSKTTNTKVLADLMEQLDLILVGKEQTMTPDEAKSEAARLSNELRKATEKINDLQSLLQTHRKGAIQNEESIRFLKNRLAALRVPKKDKLKEN